MSYYSNPEQLRAAVETATAMERLFLQYSAEELIAMGFDLSSHTDPDPDQPYAHLVAAEMLRHAHDTTANTPLGKILFDEHRRSAGLLTTEELALRAARARLSGDSEGAYTVSLTGAPVGPLDPAEISEVQLANAPLASLSTADVDSPYKGALAPEAGGIRIDGAIS